MLHVPLRLLLVGCLAAFVVAAPAAPEPLPAPRPAADPFAAGTRFAAAGKIDRFVATSAGWTLPADDGSLWQPALDLARWLADDAGNRVPWPPTSALEHFISRGKQLELRPATEFVRADRPHRQRDRDTLGERHASWPEWVIAPGVASPRSMRDTLVIARGPVSVPDSLGQSLVYANGDVTIGDRASAAVVVADGDVTVGSHATDVIVLARGNIRVGQSVIRSVLVAGGTVTVGDDWGDRNPDVRVRPVVREVEPNPLGFMTWFELSAVGVEVAKADGGVAVTAVAAGEPLATAGVHKGDLITQVGEHAVGSPEELRRRLRDAHAVQAEAVLTIRRDGQPLTVRVPLPH